MPTPALRAKNSTVPRVVSFIVLLAILLLMGAVFFQVMAHFVVPLFLAAVLVVVFKPLHTSVRSQIPQYPRVAALATTLLILLAVLLPTVWLGWKAALEFRVLYRYLSPPEQTQSETIVETEAEPDATDLASQADADAAAAGDAATEEVDATVSVTVADGEDDEQLRTILATLVRRVPKQFKELYYKFTGEKFTAGVLRSVVLNARGIIGDVAVSGFTGAIKVAFGLVIMVLALYYFLADGPAMLASMMKLSPLDDEYERELLDKFANISRAVVVASLASAAAQGLLAGLGYAFALDASAPVFLLTMLTMVLAIVPFAGAAAVWVPTVIWIYLYQPLYENGQPLLDASGEAVRGDSFTAICLAIYGLCVVSAIDNVIKPLVLHGQSNLHPLVALISILGGVQTLGPIGILVGPMLVAFIQALMNMINKELVRLGDGTLAAAPAGATPLPLGPATMIEAEAAAEASGGIIDKLAAPPASPAPQSSPSGPAPPSGSSRAKSKRRRR